MPAFHPAFILIPAILVGLGLAWPILVTLIAHLGGWAALSKRYAGSQTADGEQYSWRSGSVGWFSSYRKALVVQISPDGIALIPNFIFSFSHKPLMIPWRAVRSITRGWSPLVLSSVLVVDAGDGSEQTVTLYGQDIADSMRKFAPMGLVTL